MAIQKIEEGISGQQAAEIIYENDILLLENIKKINISEVLAGSDILKILPKISSEVGAFRANGTVNPAAVLYTSSVYRVPDIFRGASVIFSGYMISGQVLLAFDETGRFVNSVILTANSITENATFIIPENCHYLGITTRTATGASLISSENIFADTVAQTELVDDVSALRSAFDLKYAKNLDILDGVSWTDGYYRSDGTVSSDPAYRKTGLIPLFEGLYVYKGVLSGNLSIWAYDKLRKVSRIYTAADAVAGSLLKIEGAAYVSVSIAKSVEAPTLKPSFDILTKNNTFNDVNIFNDFSSNEERFYRDGLSLVYGEYGGVNAVVKSDIIKTDKVYIAFDFKLNADINTGASASVNRIATIQGGSSFFDVVVKKQEPLNYSAVESSALPSLTTNYPAVRNRGTFGWRSNTPAGTVYLGERNPKIFQPISGKPLISIRYAGVTKGTDLDRDAPEVQADLTGKNVTVTITSSNFIITDGTTTINLSKGVSKTLRQLFNELKALEVTNVLAQKLEIVEYGIDGFSSDVLQTCSAVPLISQYPSKLSGAGITAVYDAFPFFIRNRIDPTWHTCEIIIDGEILYFQIDGQFKSQTVINVSGLMDEGIEVYLGGGAQGNEILHEIKNIEIVSGNLNSAEITPSGKIISDRSPAILGLMMHGVFEGAELDGQAPNFVSLGGTVPDKYRPNYGGNPNKEVGLINHVSIATSTGRLDRVLRLLSSKGYVQVTYEQISQFKKNGVALPKRSFFTLHDDRETYIFDNQEMKAIYEKYGYKATFCIEGNSYDINSPECAATPEQISRILQLNISGWETIIHGYFASEFTGKSYRRSLENISESIEAANNIYCKSSFWSNSANASTFNSQLLFEAAGISLAIATDGWYTTRATSDFYIRRNECCDRTPFSILEENIF